MAETMDAKRIFMRRAQAENWPKGLGAPAVPAGCNGASVDCLEVGGCATGEGPRPRWHYGVGWNSEDPGLVGKRGVTCTTGVLDVFERTFKPVFHGVGA